MQTIKDADLQQEDAVGGFHVSIATTRPRLRSVRRFLREDPGYAVAACP